MSDGGLQMWWQWIAIGAVQTAALAAVVWVIDRVGRIRFWPQLLSTLWLLVLLRPLVPVSLTVPDLFSVLPTYPPAAELGVARDLSMVAWLAGLWIFGSAAFGLVVLWRYRRERALLERGATAPSEGLRRVAARVEGLLELSFQPRLRVCSGLRGPLVAGVSRPVVLIPHAMAARGDLDELRHVLAHEFAHLKRRDPWWSTAELAVALVFWFNPAVWIALGRLRQWREVCRDRDACLALGSEGGYRSTLAGQAETLIEGRTASLAFLGGAAIAVRLRRLMRPVRSPQLGHHAVTAAAAAAVFGAFLPAVSEVERQLASPFTMTAAGGEEVGFDELEGCLQKKYAVFAALAVAAPEESQPPGSQIAQTLSKP